MSSNESFVPRQTHECDEQKKWAPALSGEIIYEAKKKERMRHCQERLKVSKRRWPRTKESNAAARETSASSRKKRNYWEQDNHVINPGIGQRPKENDHKHAQ